MDTKILTAQKPAQYTFPVKIKQNLRDVAEVEELSDPECTHHAYSAGIYNLIPPSPVFSSGTVYV